MTLLVFLHVPSWTLFLIIILLTFTPFSWTFLPTWLTLSILLLSLFLYRCRLYKFLFTYFIVCLYCVEHIFSLSLSFFLSSPCSPSCQCCHESEWTDANNLSHGLDILLAQPTKAKSRQRIGRSCGCYNRNFKTFFWKKQGVVLVTIAETCVEHFADD